MIKRIISILLGFILLYVIAICVHTAILEKQGILIPFSINKLYVFHAGFSILICINLQILSTIKNIHEQLGFIYLGMLFFKIILFTAIFYQSIIKAENLTNEVKLSILIPTFIFLITEVFFVVKILNKKQ